MLFSYQWLQSFFEQKLPAPEQLAELLTLHSFEVEGLRQNPQVKDDIALDIAILPNRAPDAACHLGVARELGAILGLALKQPAVELKADKAEAAKFIQLQIENQADCARYTARVIRGIKVGPSPEWLKARLAMCGLQSINNVVDAVNFTMLHTGQPLHAFDLKKLAGGQLLVRRAKSGEYLLALDEKTYQLDPNILVIADTDKPVAIAGIKGGKDSQVDKKTRDIVIESANFAPALIRAASKTLRLSTDASWRFERGLDPNLTAPAADFSAQLIIQLAKGKSCQGYVDSYPRKHESVRIKLDLREARAALGYEFAKQQAVGILEALGFSAITQSDPELLLVTAPTFRLDINIPEDLIEELGRFLNAKNLLPTAPMALLKPVTWPANLAWQNLAKSELKALGFCELYTYSFFGMAELQQFGVSESATLVELANPLSSEQKYLRPALLPKLLKAAAENLRFSEQLQIFELGKVYNQRSGKPQESSELVLLLAAKNRDKELFYVLKGYVAALLEALGISEPEYLDFTASSHFDGSLWHKAKSANIVSSTKQLGVLGQLSLQAAKNYDLADYMVMAARLDFELLCVLASSEHVFEQPPIYPGITRDLALLVPLNTKTAEVLTVIKRHGSALLRAVELFDIYAPPNKTTLKSLAFHLMYRATDRTLTAQVVDELHQKIITALQDQQNWQAR